MTFSEALTLLKQGFRVRRSGWNGKANGLQQFVEISSVEFEGGPSRPWLAFVVVPGDDKRIEIRPWLASQADLLTDDWEMFPG